MWLAVLAAYTGLGVADSSLLSCEPVTNIGQCNFIKFYFPRNFFIRYIKITSHFPECLPYDLIRNTQPQEQEKDEHSSSRQKPEPCQAAARRPRRWEGTEVSRNKLLAAEDTSKSLRLAAALQNGLCGLRCPQSASRSRGQAERAGVPSPAHFTWQERRRWSKDELRKWSGMNLEHHSLHCPPTAIPLCAPTGHPRNHKII